LGVKVLAGKIKSYLKQVWIILIILLVIVLPAYIGWTNVYPID
tara:strand:+ start:1168 stop:1296 length:129 start_codon:yes stop_codon:yes gene_type:complete